MQEDTSRPTPTEDLGSTGRSQDPRPNWLATWLRNVRGALRATWGWPTGRWPTATILVLFLCAVLIVGIVELLPRALSDVTLSVRARTEFIELVLDPELTYIWWLPAGSYSLLDAAEGCEQRDRLDVECTYGESTAIKITKGATVQLELIPPSEDRALRFSAALKPATGASLFEVRNDDNDLLFETRELVNFQSGPVILWRIPLILQRVQIGGFPTDSVSAADTTGDVRQPIMTEGDVRIFARSIGGRYRIQEERFDPADVVQIPADPDDRGVLLGLLSLEAGDDSRRSFDVTMHTALAEVFVRRFGAAYRIGVSMWSIVSQLPTWTALWVVWVSLIVIANYHAARLQQLQGEP